MSNPSLSSLVVLSLALLLGPPTREGGGDKPSRAKTNSPAPGTSSSKPKRAPLKAGKPPAVKKKVAPASTGKPKRALSRPDQKPPRAASKPPRANYEAREKQAPKPVRAELDKVRAEIKKKNYSFEVGYTEAMDKPVGELVGLTLPAAPLADASKQNDRARRALKGRNLMVRSANRATIQPKKVARANIKKGSTPTVAGGPGHFVVGSGSGAGGTNDTPAALGNAGFADMCSPSSDAFTWEQYLTPIRNQGSCGSCWAFAAVSTLESSNAIVNGGAPDLAEQHALSCSGGGSCSGGWYTPIFEWLAAGKDGLQAEDAVPYQASNGQCTAKGRTPYEVEAFGWVDPVDMIPSVDEMKAAMCKYGPLTAAVAATPAFIAYSGGVFDEKSNTQINHAITLVGWDDSKGAWLLRNSWGTNWGDGGYMWIDYGSNSVGAYANWALVRQDENAKGNSDQGPKPKSFDERNLRVVNESGQDLSVEVQFFTERDGKDKWLPGTPGKSKKTNKYTLKKGQSLNLDDPTHKPFMLQANKVRIWAKSTSGKSTSWTTWKSKDLVLAPQKYDALEIDVFELRFLPGGKDSLSDGGQPKTKEQLFDEAYDLFAAGKYAEARNAFGSWRALYPTDKDAPYALYFQGIAEHELGNFWESLYYFADFADAYWDHDWIPYVYYWAGSAYVGLGECGYATQLFEVVAYGDVGAPKEWVDSAVATIDWLSKDDGTYCTSWD